MSFNLMRACVMIAFQGVFRARDTLTGLTLALYMFVTSRIGGKVVRTWFSFQK